jgi:lysophospholipase L1-like esterase
LIPSHFVEFIFVRKIVRTIYFAWAVIGILIASSAPLAQAATTAPIQRILVYGDSNSWGWKATLNGFPTTRYSDTQRWAGVLQKQLGRKYQIEVDALSGRTVNVSYQDTLATLEGSQFNGLQTLPAVLAKQAPLDLVIIMLGTNDIRDELNRSPEQISQGVSELVQSVHKHHAGIFTQYAEPKVLVVVPPTISDTSQTPIHQFFASAQLKSQQLSTAYRQSAKQAGYTIIDAGELTTISSVDGVHMTQAEHALLGKKMAPIVRHILAK